MTNIPPRRLFSPAADSARLQPSATPAPSHQQAEPATAGQASSSNLARPSLTPREARYLRRSLNYSTPQNSAASVAQALPDESAQTPVAAQNVRNVRRRLNPDSEATPAPQSDQQVAPPAANPRTSARMPRRHAMNLGTPVNLMPHLDAAAVSPDTIIAGDNAQIDDKYTAPGA